MPYTKRSELPDGVQKLPAHAQDIYMAAFNAAYDEYDGNEGKAHSTAWAAVKTKYRQNEDGIWVAKEAKEEVMPIESLQEKYSEIIQEVGKRNASVDSTRIKKIMQLCQELLSSEDVEESAVIEAISQCDDILLWLQEQNVMKTEDGVKFPSDAFAYVPDAEKPSTWKLRLWEDPTKKVTRRQLGAAAAALSPGGFRGQRVEIPSADLPAVKRKIRAAYRSLDVDPEDMPKWVKESENRELIADYQSLIEANVDGKGKVELTIIRPGFNESKERYYPAEVLARDFHIFEGVKMYADHPTRTEEKERPERSVKDWVASLKNVHVGSDGALLGEATIVEPWMKERLANLRDQKMLGEMGISINAIGTATKQMIDGVKTNFVEKLVRARSVDFVTEAGAGGSVQFYESNVETDVDLIGLDSLKERRPDLVKHIESEVKSEILKEVRNQMELEEQVKELQGQVETLTTENEGLKSALEEADRAKEKADAQAAIKEAVDKADLPDAAKAKLLKRFSESITTDGLEEAIQDEKDYIATLAESGKVKELGETKIDPEKSKEALKESFMRTGMTEEQAVIAAQGR